MIICILNSYIRYVMAASLNSTKQVFDSGFRRNHSAVSPEKTLVHEGAASTTRRHDCPGLKEKTAMVSLKLQKRLAASILNCGARKIWMDPNEVSDDLVDPLNDYHVMHTPCWQRTSCGVTRDDATSRALINIKYLPIHRLMKSRLRIRARTFASSLRMVSWSANRPRWG